MSGPFGPVRVSHDGGKTFQPAPPELAAVLSQLQASDTAAAVAAEPRDNDRPADEHPSFGDWALLWVNEHTPRIEAKAKEYGSNSLAAEGRLFARACGRDSVPYAEAIEIGCMVYAYGKLERVIDAMLRGELPGIDSWHDPAVYALMAMFTRSKGTWP